MLTSEQRAEVESLGAATVRVKLIPAGPGRGAAVYGFKCGTIDRGDLEDWLIEKHREETKLQVGTLQWAKIAGWAAIASVIVGAIDILLQK
jgi:hypothetical protein